MIEVNYVAVERNFERDAARKRYAEMKARKVSEYPQARKTREKNRERKIFDKVCHYGGLWRDSSIRVRREIIAEKSVREDFYAGDYMTIADYMAEKIRREEDLAWELHEAAKIMSEVLLQYMEDDEPDWEYFEYFGAGAEYERAASACYFEERWF